MSGHSTPFRSAFIVLLIIMCTPPLRAQAQVPFWNLQEILTDVEQDLAAQKIRFFAGVPNRINIESGEYCAPSALELSREALFAYSLDVGWGEAFNITKDMFGPILKLFGIDLDLIEDGAEVIELFQADSDNEFTEKLAKLVVRKVTEGTIDALPELFNQGLNANALQEPYSDYLTDEGKRKAKELYQKYFFPPEQELFQFAYDPGRVSGHGTVRNWLANLVVGETVCPTNVLAEIDTFFWEDGSMSPGLFITISGDCDCNYPAEVPERMKLDAFTIYIDAPMTETEDGFDLSREDVEYTIEAECCGGVSFDDPRYVFLEDNSLLVGTNSSFCYQKTTNGPSNTTVNLGAALQYFPSRSISVGGTLGYLRDAYKYENGYREITSLISIKPSFTYYWDCDCYEVIPIKRWRPAVRLQAQVGFGTQKIRDMIQSISSDNLTRIGGSLQPGLLWNPCPQLYIGLFCALLDWEQDRFRNDDLGESFTSSRFSAGLNKKFLSAEIMWRLSGGKKEDVTIH